MLSRFTDVDPEHLGRRVADVESRDRPPVDIQVKEIQILHDADQRTAVVIQIFETAEDMAAAEAALDGMDPSDTPTGQRASNRPLPEIKRHAWLTSRSRSGITGRTRSQGAIRLIDADGNEYEVPKGESIVLCRCGGSKTKPFCDKTHSQIGFEAAERAVAQAGD